MQPIKLNDMIANYIIDYSISNSVYDYFEFNIEEYFDEETENYIKDNYDEIASIIEEDNKVLNVYTEDNTVFGVYLDDNYNYSDYRNLVREICNKYKVYITYEELREINEELNDKFNSNISNLIIEYLKDIGKDIKVC